MIEKRENYNKLFDIYQSLLTKKQKTYFEMYYKEDHSLFEIANFYNVSRNAVYDQLNKTIKKLENYEKHLKILEKEQYQKKQYQLYLDTNDIKHLKNIIEMEDDESGI